VLTYWFFSWANEWNVRNSWWLCKNTLALFGRIALDKCFWNKFIGHSILFPCRSHKSQKEYRLEIHSTYGDWWNFWLYNRCIFSRYHTNSFPSKIFVIVSVITVLGIYLDKITPNVAQKIRPNAKAIVARTFFLNLLTGMRGSSGGSLFPPFLRTMRFDMHKAIATSLLASIFTATAGMIIYWYRGDIVLIPALAVIIGSIGGARIGSLLSLKTKPRWLEFGLSIFVIILALATVYKALSR